MKKYIVAFGLCLMGMGVASAASFIENVTTTTVVSSALSLQPGESLTYSLSGTATGQIQLQRSVDGNVWDPTGISATGSGAVSASGTLYNDSRPAHFRWSTVGLGTGTWVVSLADNDDFVQEYFNRKKAPIMQIWDEGLRLLGYVSSRSKILHSTDTTSGNSLGNTLSVYLSGSVPAVEGSVIIATTPVANKGVSGAVSPAVINQTSVIGVAAHAASTGSVLEIYLPGSFALGRTTGTVVPGDALMTSNDAAGYFETVNTSSHNAFGTALGTGVTGGGLTKIRVR